MKNTSFGDIFTTIVISVSTIGLGALVIDWMKANGKWPKPKLIISGDNMVGCDKCPVGEDPIVEASGRLV